MSNLDIKLDLGMRGQDLGFVRSSASPGFKIIHPPVPVWLIFMEASTRPA